MRQKVTPSLSGLLPPPLIFFFCIIREQSFLGWNKYYCLFNQLTFIEFLICSKDCSKYFTDSYSNLWAKSYFYPHYTEEETECTRASELDWVNEWMVCWCNISHSHHEDLRLASCKVQLWSLMSSVSWSLVINKKGLMSCFEEETREWLVLNSHLAHAVWILKWELNLLYSKIKGQGRWEGQGREIPIHAKAVYT